MKFRTIMKSCGAVLAITLTIAGILEFVDYLVERKVKSDEFIQAVAANVRPFLVFDETEAILADKGAWQYIDKIEVTPGNAGEEPDAITVFPKIVLNVAPILESLDADFVINERRDGNMNWTYELGSIDRLLLESSATLTRWRFRLEIIR